ncbi:MAG TPA: beta-galactosidase, partial [Methylomirabilota bacterium]|nr:beta-galactosidase [Methylomirabilota bacterium]
VENMVNRGLCLKWNSSVTNWDKFVTDWARDGRPDLALVRDYCLDDPAWRASAREQMQRLVGKNRVHNPLAYDIRDELSTTISANPFDYDFNPTALAGFRDWLKTQYRGLAGLNAEWQTQFASWDQVKPFTTDAIKNRMATGGDPPGKPDWQALARLKFNPVQAAKDPTRWNFSPWADFRTYMDISLARALDELRLAAHAIDPLTPVGIEGTQMPHAFGGYDLWRLSRVLDWVEPYDIGSAREILGSFMPGKPILTTVFETETRSARRRLWHLLLEGDCGCVIWWSEDCFDWKRADYKPTAKSRALTPVLQEMTSPRAQLFLRAEPEYDPIFIHYSQPSIQVDWLLESMVDGSSWLRRFSSFEAEHNQMARARNAWLKLFQDLGYTPRFISSEQVESGALPHTGPAALVLPDSRALSDKEAAAIETFLRPAGTAGYSTVAFSSGVPGTFDQHGKLRSQPALAGFLFSTNIAPQVLVSVPAGPASVRSGDISSHAVERRQQPSEWLARIARHLKFLPPPVSFSSNACVRLHRYGVQGARLLAFERNIDYHMSEDLKQAGGNESLERPIEIEATLPETAHWYDLNAATYLGHTNRLRFVVDPWRPSLFAGCATNMPASTIVQALLPPR